MNAQVSIEMNHRQYHLELDDFGRVKYDYYDPEWHRHAVYHLILVTSGACLVEIEKHGTFRLDCNDLLFINPLVPHRFRSLPEVAVEHTTMLWRFVDQKGRAARFYLQEIYAVPHSEAAGFSIAHLSEIESLRFREKHQKVLNLLRKSVTDQPLDLHFFVSWFSFFELIMDKTSSKDNTAFTQLTDRMMEILLEAVPNCAFCNEDIGEMIGRHHNYLNMVFRRQTGLSLRRCLLMLRLEKSTELLLRSDFPIQETALRCGFADSGYFAKVFRKNYHVSPRDFRKRGIAMPGFFRQRETLFAHPKELQSESVVVPKNLFPR